MSIKTKIIPFSPRLTSGLQDITDPSIDSTPVAIYIHLFASEQDNSPADFIHRSIGASDGTNQWVCHGWWTFNGSVQQGRTFRNDQVVRNFSQSALALIGTASAIGGGAGPLPTGWRLNWTYTGVSGNDIRGYVVLFYGSSAVARVGVHSGPSDIALGFTPKLVFSHCASVNLNAINTTEPRLAQGVMSTDGVTTHNAGAAFTMGSGGPTQGHACFGDRIPSSGTSGSFTYTYNPLIIANTLRLIATGMGGNAAGFLALNWTGGQRHISKNTTSAPVQDVGWKPQVLGVLGSGAVFGRTFGFYTQPDISYSQFDWYSITDGANSYSNDCANNGAIRHDFNSSFVKYYFISTYIKLVSQSFTSTGITSTNLGGNPNADWILWAIEEAPRSSSPLSHSSSNYLVKTDLNLS